MPVPTKKVQNVQAEEKKSEHQDPVTTESGVAKPTSDCAPAEHASVVTLPSPPPVADIQSESNAITPRSPSHVDTPPETSIDLARALGEYSEPPNLATVDTEIGGQPSHSQPSDQEGHIQVVENVSMPPEIQRIDSDVSQPRTRPSEDTITNAPKNVESLNLTALGAACEGDLKLAEHIAKTRGLPPDLEPEQVGEFLSRYGYDVVEEQCWGKSVEQQPVLGITLTNHIEFGGHTHYELICKVLPRPGSDVAATSWRTLRRLKHLRIGLHDPVKKALGTQYNQYFRDAPFAHHAAPAGTTARLRVWFACLAGCLNTGNLDPAIVATAFRLLDGPGTPLTAPGWATSDFEQIPITASMFGSKQQGQGFVQGDLPRVALGKSSNFIDVAKAQGFEKVLSQVGFLEVAFHVEGREEKAQIVKRPLGAEFRMRSSGHVQIAKIKPHSHAAELGLEVGWVVKTVGGEDMTKKSFKQVQDAIKVGVMHLPIVA